MTAKEIFIDKASKDEISEHIGRTWKAARLKLIELRKLDPDVDCNSSLITFRDIKDKLGMDSF